MIRCIDWKPFRDDKKLLEWLIFQFLSGKENTTTKRFAEKNIKILIVLAFVDKNDKIEIYLVFCAPGILLPVSKIILC